MNDNKKYYRFMNILRFPVFSEKSNFIYSSNKKIIFSVLLNSTKIEIKDAVEKLFNVSVSFINIVIRKGKIKRYKNRYFGKRKNVKLAYVSLKKGYEININTEV